MKTSTMLKRFALANLAAASLLIGAGAASAQSTTKEAPQPAAQEKTKTDQDGKPAAEKQSETTQSVQAQVDKTIACKTAECQKQVVKEAVKAVIEARQALFLLDHGKSDVALQKLKDSIGTLELVIARNPQLRKIPIAVTTAVSDLYAKPETVRKIVDTAEDALEDGHVQVARALLADLASEVVITTEYLPLELYPDAIKAAVPLIDAGKLEAAQVAIQAALDTIVAETVVLPLPEMRALELLGVAEKLAEKSDRTEQDNHFLDRLLTAANEQAELAQALGYIGKKEAKAIKEEIENIREKTSDGKSGKGFFDKIKEFFTWS